MLSGRVCRASRLPSARAVTRATPFGAVSRPALRRRRKSLPGTSACGLLSIRGGRGGGRRGRGAEFEHGLVAHAQLANVVADRDPDRTGAALGTEGPRQ